MVFAVIFCFIANESNSLLYNLKKSVKLSMSSSLYSKLPNYLSNVNDDGVKLCIEEDEKNVGIKLCHILESEFHKAVAAKGSFTFCISGGSMLKMLSHLNGQGSSIDWSKSTMGFVSHRCVPLDDDGATYFKALPFFLQSWMDQGLKVIAVTGSSDSEIEATAYEIELNKLPESVLPRNTKGFPIFDLLLIGLGIDGHVGSIYPNLSDAYSKRIVVPATSKNGKISLSLESMKACQVAVVACAGRSSKAPLGKAQAVLKALEREETPITFPASALKEKAIWLLDEPSAILLTKK